LLLEIKPAIYPPIDKSSIYFLSAAALFNPFFYRAVDGAVLTHLQCARYRMYEQQGCPVLNQR